MKYVTLRSIRLFFSALILLLVVGVLSCPAPGSPWRSVLYPENWTSAHTTPQGHFLHDFSYAGYQNGEAPLPDGSGLSVFDAVNDHGADNTGASDATAAIQAAVDAAEVAGGIVYLSAGLYRCDGVLTVDEPNVILRGAGPAQTKLYFTKTDGMNGKQHITFKGQVTRGINILLTADGVNRATMVDVADLLPLSTGDEIAIGWVITDEFVEEHTMTGTWYSFNGQWKPFFRREITGMDRVGPVPGMLTVDVPLRYPAKLRDSASVRVESGYLAECGIEDLAIANAASYETAWNTNQVSAIGFQDVKDCWVRNVESFESPHADADGYHLLSGGIRVSSSKRVTVTDCTMQKPQHRGGGGNGYLFEIRASNEVLVADCAALNGRHNFIQNWDFGATGMVFLRCFSEGSRSLNGTWDPIGLPAYCEYHHSLAMANLVDSCTLHDGWYGGNRKDWSSGAGHTVTQSVYWNTNGRGQIRSWQFGDGYIVGTRGVSVHTSLFGSSSDGTAPEDYIEGPDQGATLEPQSLYEDQLARRLAR